jgi:hypothetical protein
MFSPPSGCPGRPPVLGLSFRSARDDRSRIRRPSPLQPRRHPPADSGSSLPSASATPLSDEVPVSARPVFRDRLALLASSPERSSRRQSTDPSERGRDRSPFRLKVKGQASGAVPDRWGRNRVPAGGEIVSLAGQVNLRVIVDYQMKVAGARRWEGRWSGEDPVRVQLQQCQRAIGAGPPVRAPSRGRERGHRQMGARVSPHAGEERQQRNRRSPQRRARRVLGGTVRHQACREGLLLFGSCVVKNPSLNADSARSGCALAPACPGASVVGLSETTWMGPALSVQVLPRPRAKRQASGRVGRRAGERADEHRDVVGPEVGNQQVEDAVVGEIVPSGQVAAVKKRRGDRKPPRAGQEHQQTVGVAVGEDRSSHPSPFRSAARERGPFRPASRSAVCVD